MNTCEYLSLFLSFHAIQVHPFPPWTCMLIGWTGMVVAGIDGAEAAMGGGMDGGGGGIDGADPGNLSCAADGINRIGLFKSFNIKGIRYANNIRCSCSLPAAPCDRSVTSEVSHLPQAIRAAAGVLLLSGQSRSVSPRRQSNETVKNVAKSPPLRRPSTCPHTRPIN